MGASVVTICDAAPVLELAEHVLDLVALSTECLVVRGWALRLRDEGMQASMVLPGKRSAGPTGFIAPVAQGLRGRERGQH